MAFTIIPASDIDRDSYIFEALGVRGAAEALLRHMLRSDQTFAYVAYAPSAVQSLRKACEKLAEEDHVFEVLKAGKSHREVTITRAPKDGKKGFTFTRTYLNADLLSIEMIRPEPPKTETPDTEPSDTDS
jgi:hypothetical protein